jgi:hypothetical protein
VGNNTSILSAGTARAFDTRPVDPNQKWGFDLSVVAVGDSLKGQLIWKNDLGQTTAPELPYGTHHLQWIVTDSCGNSTVCEYGFTVKDGKKPTVECVNGLEADLPTFCLFTLWVSDLLQQTEDNYTPSDQLKIAIRRSGMGTGFPYDPNGLPQVSVSFNYCDLGIQYVELWSKDKEGNTAVCETYILLEDFVSACDCFNLYLSGNILTEYGEGIDNVRVDINGNIIGVPFIFPIATLTNYQGNYQSNNSLPLGSNAIIQPTMILDPLNGVNTYDLILISRHILGLEPLNSPYKLISADANQSGTITTFDIVELRKLILGTYTELPNNNSWRFVDQNQVFTDPSNPFADTIREHISLSMQYSNLNNLDFTGCKIGDIDLTATPNFISEPEDRNLDLSLLSISNRPVQKGETFTVHFQTPADLAGLQFTLNSKGLHPDKIMPGPGITGDHFGLFFGGTEWGAAPAFTAAFENGNTAFDVQFTALTDGLLSEMLWISNDITESMAFEKNGNRRDVALHFEEENEALNQPILLQNSPNPWNTSTKITFSLPDSQTTTIRIFDLPGQPVYTQSIYFEKGFHQFTVLKEDMPGNGTFFYEITAGAFRKVGKMVVF